METTYFVGPMLVVQTIDCDTVKTYDPSNKAITVIYAGGKKELMTQKVFDLIKTTEPSDLTTIRNKKMDAFYLDVYPVFAAYVACMRTSNADAAKVALLQAFVTLSVEYSIKSGEFTTFLATLQSEMIGAANAMVAEIDNQYARITNYLWTQDDSSFIPGSDVMSDRSMLEAKSFIDKIQSEKHEPATEAN